MSSGDTPPTRFTSPSQTSTSTKKYPGTPKSPMLNNNNSSNSNNANSNTGNRNSQARQRLLSSKISAPRPINLPSLRREHAVGSDVPVSSPATSHGWGSTSSSPSLPQQQPPSSSSQHDDETPKQPSAESTVDTVDKSETATASSPVLIPASSGTTTKAWAVPTITQTQVPPSTDFPTAAEAASGNKKKQPLIDDKEYLKYASSDPNHRSWDEMVSEDLDDFSVDVVEFDDGTKVQVESDTSSAGSHAAAAGASKATVPVLPSERFTEDYDRSYPPKQQQHHYHYNNSNDHHYPQHHDNDHQHHHNNNPNYKPYRRSEDHGYNSRYNNSSYSNRRHSTEGSNERRISSASGTSDRWTPSSSSSTRRDSAEQQPHYGNRRPSYDRKYDNSSYHPTTLLQRPRRLSEQSFRSDHSREENNPNPLHIISGGPGSITEETEEITVAQKEVMLTAAERAKKRLEDQEAEFKATAERAKQKADALAKQAELKEKTILKKPDVDVKTTTEKFNDSPASKKSNVAPKNPSPSTPPPPQPAQAAATKAPLPPKIPDTSKPWNLVAANKQVSTHRSTSPATAPVQAATPAQEIAPAPVQAQAPVPVPVPVPAENKEPMSPPPQILKKETKPVTFMKKEPKPAAADPSKVEQAKDDKPQKPLTEDEKKWQQFVSTIKTDQTVATKQEVTSFDWNSYADRLQETIAEQDAIAASTRERLIKEVEKEIEREHQHHHITSTSEQQQQQPQQPSVEVLDYENENWGAVPVALRNGRAVDRGAWIRDEHAYNQQRVGGRNGRGRGRGGNGNRDTVISSTHVGRNNSNNNNRSRTATSSSSTNDHHLRHDRNDEKPVVVEILKKQEPEKKMPSKKTRLTNLLKKSSSPIFPDFIDKLAGKKPANMSFMVDTEESDEEITMMGQDVPAKVQVEEETVSIATSPTTATSNSNSTASTPPKSQFPHQQRQQHHQRRMNVNRHFPVLVYQYPNQSTAATSSDKVGPSSDLGSESPSTHHQHPHPPQHQQHRPMGVYLMPQQPYLTNNQYIVPYPQAATGNVQSVYFPTLSWQQQQQQQQQANMPSRPHYNQQPQQPHQQQQHRRPFNNNNNFNDFSSPITTTTSNGFKHYRYPNNSGVYQNGAPNGRGNSYRKRGGGGGGGAMGSVQNWSGFMVGSVGRGRGGGSTNGSRGSYQQQHHYNSGYTHNQRYNNDVNMTVNEMSSTPPPPTATTTESLPTTM